MAGLLFQYRFISVDTKDMVNQLNITRRDMARILVDDLQAKVKSYPEYFEIFLTILTENLLLYNDLLRALQDEYKGISEQLENFASEENTTYAPKSEDASYSLATLEDLDLPTSDDRGTVPDPFDCPPDQSLVGEDLKAAAASRHKSPSGKKFEGQMLRAFQMIDSKGAKELLSQLIIKNQSIDLNTVSDLDGKALLHLACRYDWTDWCSIIQSLIEEHQCNISAVDEDGNTPLHDAYQCGNYLAFSYLLSLPSCKPDAVNKHNYTALRMALETNDKRAVRELLSTGRVDPRSGTQRGHKYGELLEMNSLQPREHDYDGSALQMVEQLAECIEDNSRVTPTLPSYKHYFLLGTLQSIFKNLSVG